MDLERRESGQGTGAALERKGAGESVGLATGTQHSDEARDGVDWLVALREAADDGVPVIGAGKGDAPEDKGGIMEAAGGRGGAEVEEFGARWVKMEETGGYKVRLELLDV